MAVARESSEEIARRFNAPSAQTVFARVRPSKSPITISRVISNTPAAGTTLPPPVQAAYALHVHHKPLSLGETFIDSKWAAMPAVGVGSICLFDLQTSPVAIVKEPLDFTRFGISQATLDDLAYERGQAGISLRMPSLGHPDPVIYHLALALVSRARVFGEETDSLFADWIGLAFHAHVVDTYSEARPPRTVRWRVAPWRLRDACDWMIAGMAEPLSIAEVAAQVGLTPGHFARAFAQAMGEPPHKWLLGRRIERAKQLLHSPGISLAEIAIACGFSDQSHLTRVFGRLEGVTPHRWRRRLLD